ncbi:MAG: ABC transporter ATP-binding protein [Faecousia sp.]
MSGIVTKDLTKRYGSLTAVDGLNLEIREGELFALLGVNGAGKTTTIKMLSCLTKPTSGDAMVLGRSVVTEPDRVKELLGISLQETAVAPNLTVRENLELMCGLYGHGRAESRQKATDMMDSFSLTEVERSRAKTLSGGYQRRLSIAMALITEPRVLFLDEPTLGLDVLARRELWRVIEKLKGNITIILTTHYLEEAQALSDRIGIMAKGRLTAVGTVRELEALAGKDSFEDAFVALCEGRDGK